MRKERITFGWDLCYTCNYRCPYCGVWEKQSPRDIVLSPAEWEKLWSRIFDLYGSCHIYVSGGEPATYPDFYQLIKKLAKKHFPEICTNLSWKVEKLISELAPDQLRIAPTFHPTFADFKDFFQKAIAIKEYLPDTQIYYVAYPKQIKEMPERSRRLREYGIRLVPLPLRGDGFVLNSEEEREIIEKISPYKGSKKIEYQLQRFSPKGKLCRAGKDYAVIRTSGSVDRCSQYSDGGVGNFLHPDFTLLASPMPCEKDYCPIESQWILER